MSSAETADSAQIVAHFKKYQEQVAGILQTYATVQDDALLGGFLTFAHSKCIQYVDGAENNVEVAQRVMDCCWKNVHYPVLKWFQLWRQHLLAVKVDQKPRVVELRKMSTKLAKFFKIIHKFYYGVLEKLASEHDLRAIVPEPLLLQLNLKRPDTHKSSGAAGAATLTAATAATDKPVLRKDDVRAVSLMFLIHGCLLNLGSCHRYKSMCERPHNGVPDLAHYKKSMRYFNLATLVLPSVGELYLQEGLVYVHVKSFGSSTYSFARSALSRLPSSAGFGNFMNSVCERNSKIFNEIVETFHDVHKHATRGKIVNREIIETYFLVLFGARFAPELWIGNEQKNLISEVMLSHVQQEVMHKTATRYAKNLQLIFQNLILIIAGFDILKTLNRKSVELPQTQANEAKYLEFAMDYISNFVRNAVVAELTNEKEWVYLAFVRVAECWLMANKTVLHFAHRNTNFCEAMMHLMNEIHEKTKCREIESSSSHRPHRPYYFQEDVLLREFKPLKYSLSDFKDSDLFNSETSSKAFIGMADKMLSKKEEHALRLDAVAVSGKKFLLKNACGIQLIDKKFVRSAIKTSAGQKWDSRLNKQNKVTIGGALSSRDIESQTLLDAGAKSGGYSGSSVPLAPTTLEVRPSVEFTQRSVVEVRTPQSSVKSVNVLNGRPNASILQPSSSSSSIVDSNVTSSATPSHEIPHVTSSTIDSSIAPSQPVRPPSGIQAVPPIMSPPVMNQNNPAFLFSASNGPQMQFNQQTHPAAPMVSSIPHDIRQTYDVPFFANGPPPVMNNPYMQYWPHAYQPMAYNGLQPDQGLPFGQKTAYAPQPGPAQNQFYAGNYGFPQY
ncbi:LAME_0E03290g1_1 [Lachancea meyersii CBS 8951]|uniref:LAME_0E03290g1_1 n=1 Tax=Lachancea meyersii CBS 8951 TaxID=1266667 RepID=A0A1G4JGE5_9SACH|nr:LAME_0E03290g1_1 [Lachancea meyersii CBS 8951]